MTDLVGTTLGQYQIVELIGEGGMASVYKAWQPSLRRYVALKVLAPHLSHDAEFVKRFHQEAVSAANLRHTNIVTIHDVGTESGYHYIAMEFVEGTSLEERIRSGQAFGPEEAEDVLSQVGAALDYAHQRGFIHRDIKPANILIDEGGRAVLTDFGIVKALSGSGVTSALTQAGTVFGTPQYMSPEQVQDEPLDHRSDLYALGIVCYEMLSGQVPFDGTTTHAIIYAQVNNPPPPLRDAAGLEVPAPVEVVVEKMLAKERADRYNSAGAFARDLAQAISGVWPAGLGGKTAVVPPAGTGTAVMGGTPGGIPAPTVRQPTPSPPAGTAGQTVVAPPEARPVHRPTPPPKPAPTRRRRWPWVLGAVGAVMLVLVVGAVVGVLVLGVENPIQGVQTALTLRKARQALASDDYAGAADGFGQVLQTDPANGEALDGQLEAAANLLQADQFDAAIVAYERVWRARPENTEALQALGRAYEAREEWEQAAVWYERWTAAAPGDVEAFLALGGARFHLGDYANTVIDYEEAALLGADSVEMDEHLGLAYYELGEYDKAVGRLEGALGHSPEDFRLQRALGLAYFELARYGEAIEPLKNGLDQDAEDFQLQRALGVSLYAQGQPEQAMEHLDRAIELGQGRPDSDLVDVYYALGGSYFEQQDYEQAIDFYRRAQELDPEGKATWAAQARANLDEAYSQLAQRVMEDAVLDLDFSDIVTEGEETYAVARTGQRVEIEGAVRLVDGPEEGSQALVIEEGTQNLCTNPSLEVNTTDWIFSGANAPTITRDTTERHRGSASLKVTTVAPGENWWDAVVNNRDSGYTFEEGASYAISFWAKSSQAAGDVYVGLKMSHDPWKSYGSSVDLGTEWRKYEITATWESADDNNVRHPEFGFGLLPAGIDVWIDEVQVEEKAYATSYCDGSLGSGYSWLGKAHESPSQRQSTLLPIAAAGNVDLDVGSISAWARFENKIDEKDQMLFGIGTGSNDRFYFTHWDFSGLYTRYHTESGEASVHKAVGVPTDGWHHVAVTWDTADKLHYYFDGHLMGSQTMPGGAVGGNTLYVGGYFDGSLNWNDPIAQFIILDHVLTTAEVAALYRTR
jgi:tetratricopeptide (TPR) repeat protein